MPDAFAPLPPHLFYDLDNQLWYEPIGDGTIRTGFTPFAASLMGDVLVFTPKRLGRTFERGRSLATVEGGKWIGSARAAFTGTVVAQNEALMQKPELLMTDAFGRGWMLVVRPDDDGWAGGLVTGKAATPAFEAWLATGVYRARES